MIYLRLLLRGNGGNGDDRRAFPAIMRGFARTALKETLYRSVVGDRSRPRQVLWGKGDPALKMQSFAKGLQRDLAAVTNGLSLPWNSGAVEGHVNRVKMLKRQMYGRAKFDLLRR